MVWTRITSYNVCYTKLLRIGKSIRVNGVYFTVIGVSKPKGFDHGNRKVQTIYLPFSSMQQAYNFGDQIDYFAFTAKEGYQVQEVMDELIAILQKNHSIAPDDFEAIGKVNILSPAEEWHRIITSYSIHYTKLYD